jgi:hypothetical protein
MFIVILALMCNETIIDESSSELLLMLHFLMSWVISKRKLETSLSPINQ